jgi:hypothetical protein
MGGYMNLTVPRLIAVGRYGHCRSAIVDHVVVRSSPREALVFHFKCATNTVVSYRASAPERSWFVRMWQDLRGMIVVVLVQPFRFVRQLPGGFAERLMASWRLTILGIVGVIAKIVHDIKIVPAANVAADLAVSRKSPH